MKVRCYSCYEGTSEEDIHSLEDGNHVVSGTPDRVLNMIRGAPFSTFHVKILVIYDADELCDRGFKDQISDIHKHIPYDTQVVIFSATRPFDVLKMETHFLTNPVQILVKRYEQMATGIKHFFMAVDNEEQKFTTLCNILTALEPTQQMVIFCDTEQKVSRSRSL